MGVRDLLRLPEGVESMSYLKMAHKWLESAHAAPNMETARDLIERAQRALARLDVADVERYLVEETCQYQARRASARCGQPSAIIEDGEGGYCANHVCSLCGTRGAHPLSENGHECLSCELAWQEREAAIDEEEAGHRVGRG